ncbi:F-box domain-containing protein [Fusarium acuminatum]|uniref:F-box domain-containing protein n=1 Tax=Fusarium acuminatum TaxID=5515 RepID=A0ABZ2WKH3_9HYPO
MSMLKSPQSLSTLPNEIQNAIINQLDSFDKLILHTTSRHFRTMVAITVNDLLAAERASVSRGKDLLGCYDCLCLKRAECFADNTRRGKTGRWGGKPTSRFCIDCGLHPPSGTTRYNRANRIVIGGEGFVRCWCEKGGILPVDSLSENRWVCMTCWERVVRRRRQMEREQQNFRHQQEKAAKAKARAERRARWRELGRAESDIDSLVSNTTISDEDWWNEDSD